MKMWFRLIGALVVFLLCLSPGGTLLTLAGICLDYKKDIGDARDHVSDFGCRVCYKFNLVNGPPPEAPELYDAQAECRLFCGAELAEVLRDREWCGSEDYLDCWVLGIIAGVFLGAIGLIAGWVLGGMIVSESPKRTITGQAHQVWLEPTDDLPTRDGTEEKNERDTARMLSRSTQDSDRKE